MSETSSTSPLTALKRFQRKPPEGERCELCSLGLAEQHQHLIDPANRRLVCACDACAMLFDDPGQNRFRRVPRRITILKDFQMSDEQWESLHLPINLAFFYRSSPVQRVVAMFPSPAGATESLLTLEHWSDLVNANPVLAELEPDVEALLVNRIGTQRLYIRVPIDECFKLVGIIRTHWRGLSGGVEVWKELALFHQSLEQRA
jgi:hypothetical protein